jgi:hypothetical protein
MKTLKTILIENLCRSAKLKEGSKQILFLESLHIRQLTFLCEKFSNK